MIIRKMVKTLEKIIKNIKKEYDALNTQLFVTQREADRLCIILHYCGVETCMLDNETDDIIRITFFATKRQLKKIRRDFRAFGVTYEVANQASFIF